MGSRLNVVRINKTQEKFIRITILRQIRKTGSRKSLLSLRVSERLTTITESVFGLGLGLGILNLGILQALHAITKSLNGKTISISLGGIREVLFLAGPKFSDTSITFGRILNSLNLGELGVNLINFSLKTLRKGVRLSG